jgi:hypothetical protein
MQTQNALADLAKALDSMETFKGIDADLKTKEKNAVVYARLQKLWPGLDFSECPTAKEIAQCEKAASASGKQSAAAAAVKESSGESSSSKKKSAAAAADSSDAAPAAKRKKQNEKDEAEF